MAFVQVSLDETVGVDFRDISLTPHHGDYIALVERVLNATLSAPNSKAS